MTACVQCFWFFSQIGFASNRNLMSSFGKVSQPFCTDFVWASLWYFSNFSKFGTRFPYFSYSRPKKFVFGPGDVLACPRIHRFVYQSANVPQTLSDPPQKLIVHTFPSIWQSPFFINIFKQIEISSKGVSGKSDFVLIELPIGIAYSFSLESLGPTIWHNLVKGFLLASLAPIGPCWILLAPNC